MQKNFNIFIISYALRAIYYHYRLPKQKPKTCLIWIPLFCPLRFGGTFSVLRQICSSHLLSQYRVIWTTEEHLHLNLNVYTNAFFEKADVKNICNVPIHFYRQPCISTLWPGEEFLTVIIDIVNSFSSQFCKIKVKQKSANYCPFCPGVNYSYILTDRSTTKQWS